MKRLIFVYGTLKSGQGNHPVIVSNSNDENKQSKLLGTVKTPAIYDLFDGGFPIVVRGGETAIKGELYEVTDETVSKRVNNLEGYTGTPNNPNNWYDVDTFPTEFGEAEIFVMTKGQHGRTKKVPSGEWNGR